jgi:hypothetical protein
MLTQRQMFLASAIFFSGEKIHYKNVGESQRQRHQSKYILNLKKTLYTLFDSLQD